MEPHELISLTLDRLIEQFHISPESFEYLSPVGPYPQNSVVWRPKIQLNDHAVDDPNNAHAIIATFNSTLGELTCKVYLKAPSSFDASRPDSTMVSKRWFEKYRLNHRKFGQLRDLILERDRHKENMAYLRKLDSIFPDTLNKHLL